MKNTFILISLCLAGFASFAQLQNPGMENPWRNATAGFSPSVKIQAPTGWYGADSLIIADGQLFLLLQGGGGSFHQQLFKDSTHVHSGSYSAKLMTLKQDTLGRVPGTLGNARISVDLLALAGNMSDPLAALSYSGGTPVSEIITSVSAWVAYYTPGNDQGTLAVEAIKFINGKDSIIGAGATIIDANDSFSQVTASIIYTTPNLVPDTIRIGFLSSLTPLTGVDSSTLYVDDVTMSSDLAVSNVTKQEYITVTPNPSTGIFYLHSTSTAGTGIRVFSVNGQMIVQQNLTGNDQVDLSNMAPGLYFYTVQNKNGADIQTGKIALIK